MAKGVGLDIGEYEIKVVELDGSYKKPRLTKVSIDAADSAAAGDDEASRAAEALHVLKDAGIARENVCMGFPCREVVQRTITVPFVGDDNIRKVVKFEVEGTIHSHNVDDMVVDFLTIEPQQTQTKVMVVAAPKAPLRARLKALEAVGIEPETVDLDATSLFRTADWLGCFAADAVPANADGVPGARLVVEIGARSSAVLVVIDGKLLDMRTLRTGTEAIVDELTAAFAAPANAVREVVIAALQTGQDQVLALQAEAVVPAEGGEAAPPPAAPQPRTELVPVGTVKAARDRFLDRLRRELTRFLAAVPFVQRVDAVWYTGGGSQLPGVVGVLHDVFEVEPKLLDVLGKLQHGLEEQEASTVNPRIAVAVGLALGMMGGPARLDFRREDLVFARRFDRIKFPLAVACMLGLFLVVFDGLRRWMNYQNLRREYGFVVVEPGTERTGEKVKVQGVYLQRVTDGMALDRKLPKKAHDALLANLAKAPQFKQLGVVEQALERFKREQEESTGFYADRTIESGFSILVRMAEVLKRVEGQLGRYLVTDIRLELPAAQQGRFLEIWFALRDQFRTRHAAIKQAFADDAKLPDSPFTKILELGQSDQKPFIKLAEGEEGAYCMVRVEVKPRFEVFQPSAEANRR